jgi:ferredoxin-type protein NapH
MDAKERIPGQDAVRQKGWLAAHKWLLLRRLSQFGILGLFLVGSWVGIAILKGSLASSLVLDALPLSDPYVLLQSLAAGNWPELVGFLGAAIVLLLYLVVGGRAYCSWVCPVNPVTDAAEWLRRRLGIRATTGLSRSSRYWLLGATLMAALASGTIAWELVNPVSAVFRGLVFGMGAAWGLLAAVFLLDLLISRRAWCGHLCPVGAFYSLIGTASLVRVSAADREQCDDCMDCFAVCPEHQVIRPALKGAERGIGPLIMSGNCTNCGRCIDVCARDVFRFSTRFHNDARWGAEKSEVLS